MIWVVCIAHSEDHSSDVFEGFEHRNVAFATLIRHVANLTLAEELEPGMVTRIADVMRAAGDEGFVFDVMMDNGSVMGWVKPLEVQPS